MEKRGQRTIEHNTLVGRERNTLSHRQMPGRGSNVTIVRFGVPESGQTCSHSQI
jgi:hypothetical protein